MGHLLKSKKNISKDSVSSIKHSANIELEKKLYKPIDEFKWKDATRIEISEESIPCYTRAFAI